jgi:ribosome-binding factor A
MSDHRIKKLNSLLRKEVGKIFQKDLDFDKGALVTITKAEVSPDVTHAKMSISVLPDSFEKKVMRYLQENIFEIQQLLNKRLVLRKVPKIRFVIDESIKKAARIEELAHQGS